jgi:hypothetical protein
LIFQENCIECEKRDIIKRHAHYKKDDLAVSGETQEHACSSEENDTSRKHSVQSCRNTRNRTSNVETELSFRGQDTIYYLNVTRR